MPASLTLDTSYDPCFCSRSVTTYPSSYEYQNQRKAPRRAGLFRVVLLSQMNPNTVRRDIRFLVHAFHTAAVTATLGTLFGFRNVSNHGLGRQHKAGDGSGIEQGSASDLGRVDDAGLD